MGATMGVLALTACGPRTVSDTTSNELIDFVTEKHNLLAQLQKMNRAAAKTIGDHQHAHLSILSKYCELPSTTPETISTDPNASLSALVKDALRIADSTRNDELRRILYLMSASDSVHSELLRSQ